MMTLDDWVARFDDKDMPVFKETVHSVSKLMERDSTSSSELAQTIIRDVSLTARLLKLANSIFYNTNQSSINTVSRAVILMGFDVVRDICVSLMIIDHFVGRGKHKGLVETMAKSFHAAVQARAIAEKKRQEPLEEIFIAALLSNLGEMAFWCLAPDEGVELTRLIEEKGLSAKKAQEILLGFPLSALTARLVKDWHLSGLLAKSLQEGGSSDPRVESIELGQEIAEAAIAEGWNGRAADTAIKKVVSFLDVSVQDVRKMLSQNARIAMETANRYGATAAARLIETNGQAEAGEIEDADLNLTHPEPDPMLLLKILREVSSVLDSQPDINLVLEMVLEGIHRGVGMDRALIAMLTPQRTQIRAKYVVGIKADLLLSSFVFPVKCGTGNPFEIVMQCSRGLWVKSIRDVEFGTEIMHRLRDVLYVHSFFLFPVIIEGHPLGVFYADRQPSNRKLLEIDFEAFTHLGQQANQAIHYINSLQKKTGRSK